MKYNFLLNQIKSIIDLYEKHAELSGERFNIFSIMGMESDEVRTHSSIIGELLNPKGNHSLGSKSLELFVKQVFGDNDEFELDYDSSTCLKELHIGRINEDKTEGGRIDLILKDKTGCKFVIENKIYAPEQEKQLERYKEKYPKAKILYLTLDGKDSNEEVEFEYGRISYEYHILNWIESCAKEAFDKPMVREVLNHYAYLIRKLTNQSINEEMSNEITQVIKGNYVASQEIFRNFKKVKEDYISQIFEKIKDQEIHSENTNWKIEFDENIWGISTSKVLLFSDDESSINFYYLRYEYSSSILFIGVVPRKIKTKGKRSVRRDEIKDFKGSDLVVEFLKDERRVVEKIKNEIESYISEHKEKIYDKSN